MITFSFHRKTSFNPAVLIITAFFLASCSQGPSPEINIPEEPEQIRLDIDADALTHFMDGQLYFSQGDYAMAVLEFQDALKSDSTIGTIHVSLAESYWQLGKVERAENHLKLALKKDPNDTEASEMLANQYVLRQLYPQAIKIYQNLWNTNPDNIDYGYALANLAKVQEKYTEALEVYLKIHERYPERIKPLENAAQIALATQQLILTQELFGKLLALDGSNPNYLRTMSDITILNGDYTTGLKLLERLVDIDSSNIDLQIRLGTLYYENEQKDQALQLFESLYQTNQVSPVVLYFLSTINAELNDLVKSEQYAQESVDKYPDEPRGYGNLALIELQRKNPEKAIRILQDVYIHIPGDFTINYLLGSSYHQISDYTNAQTYLLQALQIFPESSHARQTLALIYDTTKQWTKSDSLYVLLIAADSTDAQSLNNYAYSLAEREVLLKKALKMAQKAVKKEPDNSAYLDTIGWIYFKLGNVSKAHHYINSAVDSDKSNAVVLEHLGDVLTSKKMYQEAREIYRQASELEPDNARLRSKAKIN